MSTALILGAVGAVIGSVVPGVGTAIGFAVGSAVGGYIDTVNTKINNEGPRLQDRSVQISSYGASIPILYGTMRFAGNVIWSTDILERSQTQSSGGKGGEPQVNNTTYTYYASFAVLLCEGAISGVRKIWADNNLIYSPADDANASTLIASSGFAAGMQTYVGDDTQMPDPLIESYVGMGNCPAYRGSAYIVFNEFQLANYGNRIPQITCEVVQVGTDGVLKKLYGSNTKTEASEYYDLGGSWVSRDICYLLRKTSGGGVRPGTAVYSIIPNNPSIKIRDFDFALTAVQSNVVPLAFYTVFVSVLPPAPTPVNQEIVIVPLDPIASADLASQGHTIRSLPYLGDGVSTDLGRAFGDASTASANQAIVAYDEEADIFAYGTAGAGSNLYCRAIGITSSGVKLPPDPLISFAGDPHPIYHQTGSIPIPTSPGPRQLVTFRLYHGQLFVVTARDNGNATDDYYLTIYDASTGSLQAEWNGPQGHTNIAADAMFAMLCVNQNGIFLWLRDGATSANGYVYSLTSSGAVTLCADADAPATTLKLTLNKKTISFWSDGQRAIIGPTHENSTHDAEFYVIEFNALQAADALLMNVVTALSNRIGVSAADIDVSTLTQPVHGYLVTKQMAARSAVEFTLSAFRVDVVESGALIKYVRRGGAPVRTLTLDDLGAHEYSSESPDPIRISRKQEVDLPRSVTLNFTDRRNAYQQGSVTVHRLNTISEQRATLDVTALALDADESAKMADIAMMEAWVSRDTFEFATNYSHADLEPTDVVLLNGGDAIYRVRITNRTDQGGLLQFKGVSDDDGVQSSTAISVSSMSTTSINQISVKSDTTLALLDIPILQDSDNDPGFYARLAPVTTPWKGAALYEAGNVPVLEGTVSQPSALGQALTALPAYTGPETFDESSTVDVRVNSGQTLQSYSRDEALAGNGAYLAGTEIFVARTATLIGTDSYRLSGMIRYLRGTEGATHTAGERFVALSPAGTLRVNHGSADIGATHRYAAVSSGRALNVDKAVSFTNTAIGLKPFSPVQLGAGLSGGGDVTLNWMRRTRLSANFRNGVGAPLGEASESYTIDIGNAGLTTITRSYLYNGSPPFVYPNADRYADQQAGLPSPFYWRVTQMSAVVGLGTPSAINAVSVTAATLVTPGGTGAWNPADYGPPTLVFTFTNNDSTAEKTLSGLYDGAVRGVASSSFGRKYFEILIDALPSTTPADMEVGFCSINTTLNGNPVGFPSGTGLYYRPNGQVFAITAGVVSYLGVFLTYAVADVVGIAIDFNAGYAWLLKNNTSLQGSPTAGTGPLFTFAPGTQLFPVFAGHGDVNQKATLRTASAGLSYTPPTNFFPLT